MKGSQYFDWVNRDNPMLFSMLCILINFIEIIVADLTLKGGNIVNQFNTD